MGGHVVRMTAIAQWVRSLWPFGQHLIYPERRSGTRYLTLKNAARAAIVLAVAFLLFSIWSRAHPRSGASLWESRAKSTDSQTVPHEQFPVVREGSPTNYPQEGTIGPIVNNVPTASSPPPAAKKTIDPRAPQPQLGKGQRITISGGTEGVQIHVDTAPPPATQPPRKNSAEH